MKISRRTLMEMAGAGVAMPEAANQVPAPPKEGKDTPKIALRMGDAGGGSAARTPANPAPFDPSVGPRRIKQLGVNHVLGGLGGVPWTEQSLNAMMERWKAAGITVGNLMIGLSPEILYGKPGNKRDEDIEKIKQSIVAAGKAGLPVIEYNFYAHRAMEGYFQEPGRAGAGYTAFDYDRMKDLPALPQEGTQSLERVWENITYFLKAIVPVAQESGVRLALHPSDPPAPLS